MQEAERSDLVVTVNTSRLARECAVRGWSYHELAIRARVSRPTVSAAVRGRGIRPSTYHRIVQALHQQPVLEDRIDLLGKDA